MKSQLVKSSVTAVVIAVARLVVADDRTDQRRADDKRNHGFRGVARIATTSITRPVVWIGAGRKQASEQGGHSGENPVLFHIIG